MADLSQFLNGGAGGGVLKTVSIVVSQTNFNGALDSLIITPAANQYVLFKGAFTGAGTSFTIDVSVGGNPIAVNVTPTTTIGSSGSLAGLQTITNSFMGGKGDSVEISVNTFSSAETFFYRYMLLEDA